MGAIVNGAAAHGGIVKPYGSTFLIFSDYMRGVGAPVGADGPAGGVGVDARLGRPRRGRPDAPADRALRGAARDPAAVGDPPRRRQRDRRSPGGWRSNARTARWRCCSRARTSRCSTATEVASAEGLERGGYVLWESAPEPDRDPDRHRRRGRRRRSRRRDRSPARDRTRAGRLDAVHGAVRSPDAGVPRRGAAAGGEGAAGGRAGRDDELVEVGRHRRRRARARPLRRVRARAPQCSRSWASAPRTSLARARALAPGKT